MTRFRYEGPGQSWGTFGVRVIKLNNELQIVISELPENMGIHLSLCFDKVATQIAKLMMVEGHITDPSCLQWVEHYPHPDGNGPDEWLSVNLAWNGEEYVRTPPNRSIVPSSEET